MAAGPVPQTKPSQVQGLKNVIQVPDVPSWLDILVGTSAIGALGGAASAPLGEGEVVAGGGAATKSAATKSAATSASSSAASKLASKGGKDLLGAGGLSLGLFTLPAKDLLRIVEVIAGLVLIFMGLKTLTGISVPSPIAVTAAPRTLAKKGPFTVKTKGRG